MKKAFMAIAAVIVSHFAFAQSATTKSTTKEMAKPPQAVKDAFTKAYPEARNVNWDQEGDNYEAEFKTGEMKMSVEYNADGKVMETEKPVAEKDLPKGVMEYVNKVANDKDNDFKPKEMSKIVAADGTVTYEVEVKGKDYLFDKDGKFIEKNKE